MIIFDSSIMKLQQFATSPTIFEFSILFLSCHLWFFYYQMIVILSFFSLLPSLWVVIWIYSLFLLLLLLLFFHTWTTAITKKILKRKTESFSSFLIFLLLVLISRSADFQTAKKQLSSRIDLVDSNVEECKEIVGATKFEVRLYISVTVFCYPLKCIDQTAWFCF